MSLNPRQQEIVELAKSEGFVSIDELAKRFQVTTQTIRRDINALCDMSLLRRYHGGAGTPTTSENLPYDRRQKMAQEEKKKIAKLIASHIPNRASLFIDVGTTCEEIARALMDHQGLRVVTNNIQIAQLMSYRPDFEVTITGGVVRSRDRAVVGEAAIDFISQFHVDFGLLGISAIGEDGSLRDFDYRKVKVSQAIMSHSKSVFLAADKSKFSRDAMVRSGSLNDITALFVSGSIPSELMAQCRRSNVSVYNAEVATDYRVPDSHS